MNNIQEFGHGLGLEPTEMRLPAGLGRSWSSELARWPINDRRSLIGDGLLAAIPPERVGLHGEYDHAGLVKRVQLALRQALGEESAAQLAIAQRGKVVIVRGQALEPRFVRQITRLTLAIEGANFVEIVDVGVLTPQTSQTQTPQMAAIGQV